MRKAWAARNPDSVEVAARRWREANVDKTAKIMRAYYENNREQFARRRAERRARVATDARLVTESDWAQLVARHDGRCAYCSTVAPLTRDHVIPLARGGRHSIGNLLPACRRCNASKGALLLIEWRTRLAARAA